MKFEYKIRTENGYLGGVLLYPTLQEEPIMPQDKINTEVTSITLKELHRQLGHPFLDITEKTAKELGIQVTGEIGDCIECYLGKKNRNQINKVNINKSTTPGERICFDSSSSKYISLGGKFFLLSIDECTNFRWCQFMTSKDETSKCMIRILKDIASDGIKPSVLRCDNTGENKIMKESLRENNMKIRMEFTSPRTPQQNGIVERNFSVLYNKARYMFNTSGITGSLKEALWEEFLNTAVVLSNISSTIRHKQSRYLRLHGLIPKINLKKFGKVGVMKN